MKTLLQRPTTRTQQEMVDKFSVKELIEFERFSRDNAQWEAMKTCYAPDSKVTVSWFEGTGKAFVEASRRMKGYAPQGVQHPALVERRQGRGHYPGHHSVAHDHKRPAELDSDSKMLFRAQKVAGTWQLVSLNGICEKDISCR